MSAAESEPLLPEVSAQRFSSASSEGSTMGEVYQKSNLRGSAVPAQAAAVAFAGLTWALVFSKLPKPLPLFGYHPLIQSLTLILLVQSVLVLQPTSTPAAKKAGLNVHQVINILLVLPLFTAGASIMWYLHDQPGQKHFISWHGTLGAIVVIWAWVQSVIGAASVWFKGAAFGGEAKGKAIWKWHRLSGYILLPAFLLTFALAIWETTWGKKNAGTLFHLVSVGALAVLGLALAGRVRTSKLPKLR